MVKRCSTLRNSSSVPGDVSRGRQASWPRCSRAGAEWCAGARRVQATRISCRPGLAEGSGPLPLSCTLTHGLHCLHGLRSSSPEVRDMVRGLDSMPFLSFRKAQLGKRGPAIREGMLRWRRAGPRCAGSRRRACGEVLLPFSLSRTRPCGGTPGRGHPALAAVSVVTVRGPQQRPSEARGPSPLPCCRGPGTAKTRLLATISRRAVRLLRPGDRGNGGRRTPPARRRGGTAARLIVRSCEQSHCYAVWRGGRTRPACREGASWSR